MTTTEYRERSSELMSLLSSSDDAAASVRDSILMLGSAGGLAFRGAAMASSNERDLGCGNNVRRRPFISLQEDLTMEDYCFDDLMLPEKKRRLTPEQVHLLEKSFEEENKLEPEKKSELSKKLGMQPRQVAVWYQNRRARWKTKQLERDFGRLKSLYDSLVADRDSLFADNQRLRSEVLSLTEQLQAKNSSSTQDPSLQQGSPYPLLTEQVLPEACKLLPSSTTISISPEMKSVDGLISTVDDAYPPRQGSEGEGPCFQEQLDGGSFTGGQCSNYVIPSEEEDISDNGGGGYFHAILPDDDALILDHHFLCHDDDDQLKFLPEEDGGGFIMGWSVWS